MNQQITERLAFEDVAVGHAMHRGVLTCPADTPLSVVAHMMAGQRVHAVVVFDEASDDGADARLWGVVSDLDLVRAASAGDIEQRTAGGTAVTPIVMIEERETLVHAAQLMSEHEITHLLVVEVASGRPLGIISTLDIARSVGSSH